MGKSGTYKNKRNITRSSLKKSRGKVQAQVGGTQVGGTQVGGKTQAYQYAELNGDNADDLKKEFRSKMIRNLLREKPDGDLVKMFSGYINDLPDKNLNDTNTGFILPNNAIVGDITDDMIKNFIISMVFDAGAVITDLGAEGSINTKITWKGNAPISRVDTAVKFMSIMQAAVLGGKFEFISGIFNLLNTQHNDTIKTALKQSFDLTIGDNSDDSRNSPMDLVFTRGYNAQYNNTILVTLVPVRNQTQIKDAFSEIVNDFYCGPKDNVPIKERFEYYESLRQSKNLAGTIVKSKIAENLSPIAYVETDSDNMCIVLSDGDHQGQNQIHSDIKTFHDELIEQLNKLKKIDPAAAAAAPAPAPAPAPAAAAANQIPDRNLYYTSTVTFAQKLLDTEKNIMETFKAKKAMEAGVTTEIENKINSVGAIYNETQNTFKNIEKLGPNVTRTSTHTTQIKDINTNHKAGFVKAKASAEAMAVALPGSKLKPFILTGSSVWFQINGGQPFEVPTN
jgi:hypothetical protein